MEITLAFLKMISFKTLVCLFLVLVVDGEISELNDCSDIIKMPGHGFADESIFPIMEPKDVEDACRNLDKYRNCVKLKDNNMEMTDNIILYNFLRHICDDKNKESYFMTGKCIGNRTNTTEMRLCQKVQNEQSHFSCKFTDENIDCIGKTVESCGPEAVRMTKSLLKTIYETLWDIYGIYCPTPTMKVPQTSTADLLNDILSDKTTDFTTENDILSDKTTAFTTENGSSRMSSSVLNLFPSILFFWFKLH